MIYRETVNNKEVLIEVEEVPKIILLSKSFYLLSNYEEATTYLDKLRSGELNFFINVKVNEDGNLFYEYEALLNSHDYKETIETLVNYFDTKGIFEVCHVLKSII